MSKTRPRQSEREPAIAAAHPRPRFPREWRIALLVAAIALLVRALYLLDAADNPFWRRLGLDLEIYDAWAKRIASGHGLGEAPFTQAPFFPLVLGLIYALLGPDPVRALWVQAFAGAATAGLIAYLGARWLGAVTGIAAGLLFALARPAIFYTGVLLPPVWSTLLLTLALVAIQRASMRSRDRDHLLAGAAIGLATLAQPTLLALLPVVLLLLWRAGGAAGASRGGMLAPKAPHERGSRRASIGMPARPVWIVTAGAAAVLLITLLYNGIVGGAWTPVAVNGGVNLYIGNNPDATGAYVRPPGLREDRDLLGIAAASAAAGRPLSATQASSYWNDRALGFITGEPGRWLGLMARKLFFVFAQPEIPQVEFLDFEKRYSTWLRLPLPGMALLTGLGVAGAVLLARRDRWARLLVLGTGALALAIALFFITARFRQVMVPLLALLGGGGIGATVARLRGGEVPGASDAVAGTGPRRTRHLWSAGIGGLAAALLCFANPFGVDNRFVPARAQILFRLGVVAHETGNAAGAEASYREALALDPALAKAHLNLGALLIDRGDLAGAQPHIEEAARLDSQLALAHLHMAQLRHRQGDAAGAIDAYRRFLALDPGDFRVRETLAALLYASGDIDAATNEYAQVVREAPAQDAAAARAQALTGFVRARADDAGWPANVALRRGDLLLVQGDREGALAYYREAVTTEPDSRSARAALQSAMLPTLNPK